jgi:predicted  nucleic acid-binding Zn-ribbon protein
VEQQNTTDNAIPLEGERAVTDHGLAVLWDRVRQAGDLIRQLRQEKTALHGRLAELEAQVRTLEATLQAQRELVRSLEAAQKERTGQSTTLAEEERAALVARVQEALSKLDAYL